MAISGHFLSERWPPLILCSVPATITLNFYKLHFCPAMISEFKRGCYTVQVLFWFYSRYVVYLKLLIITTLTDKHCPLQTHLHKLPTSMHRQLLERRKENAKSTQLATRARFTMTFQTGSLLCHKPCMHFRNSPHLYPYLRIAHAGA